MAQTEIKGVGKGISIGPESLPVIVGERINPTNRKHLAEDIKEGRFQLVREEAKKQAEAGAGAIDINVSVPGIDEPQALAKAVEAVQEAVDLPVVLDSINPEALARGLARVKGKALINSVNGKEESLESILPLAKEKEAAIVGLTMDESGIPEGSQKRLEIARRIVTRAEKLGIERRDILIDCLVLSAGTNPAEAGETLAALELVKKELGVNTILGVSNISFGLPYRSLLTSTFVSMAIARGLDALLVDPLDEKIQEAVRAAAVLLNQDEFAANFISQYRGKK